MIDFYKGVPWYYMRMFKMLNHGMRLDDLFERFGWKRVALYGGGYYGESMYELLKSTNANIPFVIDRNPQLRFPYPSVKIIQPHEFVDSGGADVIIACMKYYQQPYETMKLYTDCPVVHYQELFIDPDRIGRFLKLTDYARSRGAKVWYFNIYLPTTRLKNRSLREKTLPCIHGIVDMPMHSYSMLAELFDDVPYASPEYMEEIFSSPPVIEKGNILLNSDVRGQFLNVVNNTRVTTDVPDQFDNTIYLYGQWATMGVGTEDRHTIVSWLQRFLNEKVEGKRYRVVNMAVWGEKLEHDYLRIGQTPVREGDICITISFGQELHWLRYFGSPHVSFADLTSAFDRPHAQGEVFLDHIHFNHRGTLLVAKRILEILNADWRNDGCEGNPVLCETSLQTGPRSEVDALALKFRTLVEKETGEELVKKNALVADSLDEYAQYIRENKSAVNGTIGCIVMNCNPFTLGHRYLIEQACGKVDYLYIFCVEENKSHFSFADRFALLRENVKDLDNVRVLRSGRLILSATTLPDYFNKEKITEVVEIPTMDIDIFGEYISPLLNISVRFAGSEPFCTVTRHYNDLMRTILPKYGISFVEIERTTVGGRAVSAPLVRQLLREGKLDKVKEYVTEPTFAYLTKRYADVESK